MFYLTFSTVLLLFYCNCFCEKQMKASKGSKRGDGSNVIIPAGNDNNNNIKNIPKDKTKEFIFKPCRSLLKEAQHWLRCQGDAFFILREYILKLKSINFRFLLQAFCLECVDFHTSTNYMKILGDSTYKLEFFYSYRQLPNNNLFDE